MLFQCQFAIHVTFFQQNNIKSLYTKELDDARKLIDEISKEKATLQIEAGKYKTEADEWKEKWVLGEKEKEEIICLCLFVFFNKS